MHVFHCARYNKPTLYILPCSLFAHKHSGTFLIIHRWWLFYIEKFCFQHSARLFSDTLPYRKPTHHHSCWFTQRCKMYQAKEKPSDTSAVTKEQQLYFQSMSQCCRPEGPHCVLAHWRKFASVITEGLLGYTLVARYPAVMLADMSALFHVSMKISPNLRLVTARFVLLWLYNGRTFHYSPKTNLSISCSSQAVWLGKNNNVISWPSAVALRCSAGLMSPCRK